MNYFVVFIAVIIVLYVVILMWRQYKYRQLSNILNLMTMELSKGITSTPTGVSIFPDWDKCAPNMYYDNISTKDCVPCPNYMISPTGTVGIIGCTCKPNFVKSQTEPNCYCPANSYIENDTCVRCPPNTTSQAGSVGQSSCLCPISYTKDSTGNCVCPNNTVLDVVLNRCVPVPA